jgi:hypothetical protein
VANSSLKATACATGGDLPQLIQILEEDPAAKFDHDVPASVRLLKMKRAFAAVSVDSSFYATYSCHSAGTKHQTPVGERQAALMGGALHKVYKW